MTNHGPKATLKPLFGWRAAITESGLPPATRHVALALSLHMNEMGASAFPGAVALAKETGINVSTVRQRLADLVRHGYLVLVEQGGRKGERRRANAYEVAIPNPLPLASHNPLPAPPVVSDDPLPETTRRVRPRDPSPQALVPLASGNPISTWNSPANSPSTNTTMSTSARGPVERVFVAWQEATGHPKAVLDPKRRRLISDFLKHYSVEDLEDACHGITLSAFHMGQNDRGERYDKLSNVLKSSDQIEHFRDLARDGPPAAPLRQSRNAQVVDSVFRGGQ